MKQIQNRNTEVGGIGSFGKWGIIGLVLALIAFVLLVISINRWFYNQQSVYFFGYAENPNSVWVKLGDRFNLPVFRTNYWDSFPSKVKNDWPGGFYLTQNCKHQEYPEQYSFAFPKGKIFEPRFVYVAANLEEGHATINNQSIVGKTIGSIVFQFEGTPYIYQELIAGQNIREWLIGANDHNFDVIANLTAWNVSEIFNGTYKDTDWSGVIDLIKIDVQQFVSIDKPLIKIWILDGSNQTVGSCDPGLQIMSILVEARREPNQP